MGSESYPLQRSKLFSTATNEGFVSRSRVLCFLLGLAPFTAGRSTEGASFLRIPFLGDYLLTYFDILVGVGCLALVWRGSFRLDGHEKKLYRALVLVVATRILSLLVASNLLVSQTISVLRYIETLVCILLLANVLSSNRNRIFFVRGLFVGAVAESVGGLFNFISSGGEDRAIWLGFDNYKLLVFPLIACLLSLSRRRGRTWKILLGLFLFVEILATETRTALLLLFVSLLALLWTRRKAVLKPVLALLVFGLVATIPVLSALPAAREALSARGEQVLAGAGGTVGLRIILWEMAVAAYRSHPITGIGSGGFARQQNTLWLDINDVYESGYESKYETLSTHNTVLGVAAETGTVGLIAYFLWLIAVVGVCVRGIRLEAIYSDPCMLAACVCVLAMMAEDWWAQASFMPASTCLLGFILGWSRSRRRTLPIRLAGAA